MNCTDHLSFALSICRLDLLPTTDIDAIVTRYSSNAPQRDAILTRLLSRTFPPRESHLSRWTLAPDPTKSPTSGPVRAAQYVRMSTEHQKYSPENQSDAIANYARLHGIDIVQTYADHGRSGLSLTGRLGLRTLLDDVADRRNGFSVAARV
jgi:hypothetical protein